MLDYFVTQRLLPIIAEIIRVEKVKLGDSLFYFKTPSGIEIVDELSKIEFKFKELTEKPKSEHIAKKLLHIGHLKELGRCSLNMNLFVRRNIQATYEYNYTDPKGRGRRFAKIELKEHKDARKILACVCCGEDSMVLYLISMPNPFAKIGNIEISWVKCYTCDYHLRHNVGDPYFFGLSKERLFPINEE